MLYNGKNGTIPMGDTTMDYIRFGSSGKTLVMLPGLGDGLRTVQGTALPMAFAYRAFAREYTVFAFSRLNRLPAGYTTRDMARDVKAGMDALGIERADILGVSMGGMIAQHLAADFPEKVGKLVLTVTSARPNPVLTQSISEWVTLAKQGDHRALMDSNVRRIYSEGYYRKNKWLIPVMGLLTKPKSYDRFLIQAEACRSHNSLDALGRILSPTLVIGGEQDHALGGDASREIAARIPGAELKMYPQWGHGLYEEAADFSEIVQAFLKAR
ncbi:MAG: alpha/beta fold hydrolase [Faecousia sp.]